ncbi:CHAD domain-containing protein [Ferrimonas sediminicola]|uniref:CHAD domain-containing protein n=1 Tax=Ferrimonas sediminicola TaxID=2569538 RepID=A0A4U1BB33_9GAMM|nr:CHAD domain-containing protein [Ferrimonas sediminicola]TKB47769.1 CHAD domain-containing protein [Ferrimonas sediminicola]
MASRVIPELQPRLAALYLQALEQGRAMAPDGDGEPLHRYRVALRKLRCLLKLYRRHFPEEVVTALLASAAQQGRVSNEMRDLDVLAVTLGRTHPLSPQVARWRSDAFARLFLALGQLKRERQLCLSCLSLPWGKGRDSFETVTDKVAQKLAHKVKRDLARALSSGEAEDWHRLRLRIKAQRYLKEVCQPHKPWSRERALQDVLGAFNDSCSQIAFLQSKLDDTNPPLRRQLASLLEQTQLKKQRQLAALNSHSWQGEQN